MPTIRPTTRDPRLVWILALVALLPCGAVGDQLIGPSPGRPAFVAPGGSFRLHAFMEQAPSHLQASLQHPDGSTVMLDLPREAIEAVRRGGPVAATVPGGTPTGTYDLILRDGQRIFRSQHAVRVGALSDRIRLIHLGPPGKTGRYPDALLEEVDRLAPTAILVQADHPMLEAMLAQLQRIDAPSIVAAGARTRPDAYARLVAASPIGMVRLGPHRCVIVHDRPDAPLLRDEAQLKWLEDQLTQPLPGGVTIGLSGGTDASMLRRWEDQGTLGTWLRKGRIGLWLNRAGADPLPQSARSTMLRQVGVDQFQVFDLEADGLTLLGGGAWAVGRLNLDRRAPEAGGTGFQLESGHGFDLPRVSFWLPVRGEGQPWCLGGRVAAQRRTETGWICRLEVDVPARGIVQGWLGTGRKPIEPTVEAAGPVADDALPIRVRNPIDRRILIRPEVRLGGEVLTLTDASGRQLPADYPVPLEAGGVARLRVVLPPGIVDDSRGSLQVYLHGRPVLVPQQVPIPHE